MLVAIIRRQAMIDDVDWIGGFFSVGFCLVLLTSLLLSNLRWAERAQLYVYLFLVRATIGVSAALLLLFCARPALIDRHAYRHVLYSMLFEELGGFVLFLDYSLRVRRYIINGSDLFVRLLL